MSPPGSIRLPALSCNPVCIDFDEFHFPVQLQLCYLHNRLSACNYGSKRCTWLQSGVSSVLATMCVCVCVCVCSLLSYHRLRRWAFQRSKGMFSALVEDGCTFSGSCFWPPSVLVLAVVDGLGCPQPSRPTVPEVGYSPTGDLVG